MKPERGVEATEPLAEKLSPKVAAKVQAGHARKGADPPRRSDAPQSATERCNGAEAPQSAADRENGANARGRVVNLERFRCPNSKEQAV